MVLEKVTGYLRFSRECTLKVKDMHCYSVNMTYIVMYTSVVGCILRVQMKCL